MSKTNRSKQFIDAFEPLLRPYGFEVANGVLCRIDEANRMALTVSRVRPLSGRSRYSYNVVPYCERITKDRLLNSFHDLDRIALLTRPQERMPLAGGDYESWFSLLLSVFESELLDKFTSVHTLEDCIAFQDWHLRKFEGGMMYREREMTWQMLAINDFDKAYSFAKLHYQKKAGYREALPENMAIFLDSGCMRPEDLQRLTEKSDAALMESANFLQLFHEEDHKTLLHLLHAREEESRIVCRDFLGRMEHSTEDR